MPAQDIRVNPGSLMWNLRPMSQQGHHKGAHTCDQVLMFGVEIGEYVWVVSGALHQAKNRLQNDYHLRRPE